jgi:hypothetical protein
LESSSARDPNNTRYALLRSAAIEHFAGSYLKFGVLMWRHSGGVRTIAEIPLIGPLV